ncbi:IclR family transcriptional regulator [Pseudoclavibacter sp. RFBA6]|uniref:IclR family transcriptional regulator n=1 Tax=Pseudoclavibacter sp. RFBA6 TaxID=2080573 RepID=UPI000CE73B56|nr:IclR family transcriptional regulator [Pseudoclavibacter sp. RFBA6]PPG39317.1 transcriptional regulator [Pseudoclavibacter sp. RFBA6]
MAEPSTRTVERALTLLASVCERDGLSLAESARLADLSPSTSLRLLRTLESAGFVRRDDQGEFRAGSRMVQLGARALSNDNLAQLSAPAMRHVAERTGESVYLCVEGHADQALYIAIHEGTHSVRHTNWVGRTIPLDGSASGRVLRGETPSIGYVTVERGIEQDVTAIAAPIEFQQRVLGSLSLLVPSYRVTKTKAARYGELLTDAAASIERSLGTPPQEGIRK